MNSGPLACQVGAAPLSHIPGPVLNTVIYLLSAILYLVINSLSDLVTEHALVLTGNACIAVSEP